MKTIFKIVFLYALLSGSNAVYADTTITAVPTGWVIQNYVPGTVAVWYTGSSCTNGNYCSHQMQH